MFGVIEIEKNKFYCYICPILLGDADTDNVLVSNKIFLVTKNINTLLVTCMMMKLSHYIKCFQKRRRT